MSAFELFPARSVRLKMDVVNAKVGEFCTHFARVLDPPVVYEDFGETYCLPICSEDFLLSSASTRVMYVLLLGNGI